MLALLEATWDRALPAIRERVGAAVFDAWFGSVRPIALERGVVHLETPNRMTRDHVARFYLEEVGSCLSAELGTSVTVRVEAAPEAFSPEGVDVGPTRPIVDASNQTAFLALGALLEGGQELPAKLFVFHGPPGVGKTFLLNWWRGALRSKVAWFELPQLVRAFQASMREGRLDGLRKELARPVPLVLDEFHRIAGHSRLQAELAKVLEARVDLDQPTLIASRWHPTETWRLHASLETRLMSGFVSQVGAPTPGARLQFLRALEGKPSQNGRARAVEDLARRARAGGYRDLRRAWTQDREGGGRAQGRSPYFQLIDPRTLFDRMHARVSESLDVSKDELIGASQTRHVSHARKILAWLCVQEGLSRAEVGRFLSGRTRAAISYSIQSLEREMEKDDALRQRVEGML